MRWTMFLLACGSTSTSTVFDPPANLAQELDDTRCSGERMVFVGEFVRAYDEPAQLGYVRPLRVYVFKPLQGWQGHFSGADPVDADVFVDVCNDPTIAPCEPRAPPEFRVGERVLVTIEPGGMSHQIAMMVDAIREPNTTWLGAPCWARQ